MRRPRKTYHRKYSRARWVWGYFIVNLVKEAPCQDCGRRFPPECMDFDHIRGRKRFTINRIMAAHLWLYQEIEKCDLVCANCHRIRTKKRAMHGISRG